MAGALVLGTIGEVPHKGRAVPIIANVGAGGYLRSRTADARSLARRVRF